MKKITSWVVCTVLLVATVVLSFGTADSYGGSAGGTPEKLTTVEEVTEVLDWLSTRSKTTASTKGVLTTDGNGGKAADNNENKETPENKYTSVTLRFTNAGSVSSSSRYSGNSKSSSQRSSVSFEREMTCYFSKDASFYDVSFYANSSSRVDSASSKSYTKLKAKFYMDDQHLYLYISEFVVGRSGTDSDGEAIEYDEPADYSDKLNKWIDFTTLGSGGAFDSFTSINDTNFKIMSTIGTHMESKEDESVFSKSGKRYNMKKAYTTELCKDIFRLSGGSSLSEDFIDDVEFSVDMSSAKKPSLDFFYSIKGDDDESYSLGSYYYSSSYDVSATEKMKCEISNVNNTSVKMPKGRIYSPVDFGIDW